MNRSFRQNVLACLTAAGFVSCLLSCPAADATAAVLPKPVAAFVTDSCFDCHGNGSAEGGLDLETLGFDLDQPEIFRRWVLIHDRIRDGEMPPPDDGIARPVAEIGWSSRGIATEDEGQLSAAKGALRELATELVAVDRKRISEAGRSSVRRLNRFEYENLLREVLSAPWLNIADRLPEDGVEQLFNKSGNRLDMSHVQLSRSLETAEHALRLAVDAAAHPSQTRRFYAREEPSMHNYVHYRFGQMAATRAIVPLLDLTPEPDVIRKRQPLTVGEADPERREREAMGVFSGVYSATTKYDFTRIDAPTDGQYRLRFRTYTFMAGPNGADGGDDHGLTGGDREWWRPDRNVAVPGTRSEPVTLYALAPSGDSRWLTTFDSQPEPTVFECVVSLKSGEGIRPDAARLVRTRPGWKGNPNATAEGVPGFAMNWLEVEGPLNEVWPPASYSAVLGDLPFEVAADGKIVATSSRPDDDAQRLLAAFYHRAVSGTEHPERDVEPYVRLYASARARGFAFTDAVITAASAILCAPECLYLEAQPGPLPKQAFGQRLAYFLWNGPPEREDAESSDESEFDPADDVAIRTAVEHMLDDPRSTRFLHAFLDYWLNLRELNANAPDAELYPDYYLDELLTESSLRETRLFFQELLEKDLPARNLVDAKFAFVNERLAEHYGLPAFEGVVPRRVELPDDSPRGGLLTQASVLRVTANGTTTSPVVRGAWIMERLIGTDIPSPPSGIAAVEPDTRGATTIREQLEKHRSVESCNACHARFDPAGFALESFDVAGGWRQRYRALGDEGDAVEGIGKNGHAFRFRLAQPVDCQGVLASGKEFDDIRELKRLLAADERRIARNLVQQLIVYATGAPVSFADRVEVEDILDRAAPGGYGVRTLIHEVVRSRMFRNK